MCLIFLTFLSFFFFFLNSISFIKAGTKTQTLRHFEGLDLRSAPNPGVSQSISVKFECFSETHSKSIHQTSETTIAANKSSHLSALWWDLQSQMPGSHQTHWYAFTAMTHWIRPALGLVTQMANILEVLRNFKPKWKVFLTTLVILVFSTFMALGLSYYKALERRVLPRVL